MHWPIFGALERGVFMRQCTNDRLKVVLCWHMHQPQYQDLISGEYLLPWTYLHAIKDYVDMAAHLEAAPDARAVVNFAPILLEQIEDYAAQVQGFLHEGKSIRDPLLASLDMAALPVDSEQRLALLKACLRANEERVIKRFPDYGELAEMASWYVDKPESRIYLADQLLADLVVWYHLAWLGETVRRGDERVQTLLKKGRGFTLHERRSLMEIVGAQLAGVIGRYRALAKRGKVELAISPYAHPIVPLMLDLQSAREALPEVDLPESEVYPGGEERVRWHIEKGLEIFESHFGFRPHGCWPSEGSVSDATLGLLDSLGFKWAASGESVMRNSLARAHQHDGGEEHPQVLHHAFRIYEGKLACFFRDDGLSDLVGFTYANWHADDAVANLIHHLENIEKTSRGDKDQVVSIILDGENAWEYYPENGYYFLNTLYEQLSGHAGLEMTTFSALLDAGIGIRELPGVVAGSWVYGTFSTWIGDPGKNRGWDMLVDAKRAFDEVTAAGVLDDGQLLAAERQLAVCEGSDWFWWFGDANPAATVSDFEHLYRLHLSNLYQLIGKEPPEYLSHVFTHGQGAPRHGGVMLPGKED